MRRRTTLIIALVALSLVAAACTGGDGPGPSSSTPTTAAPRPSSPAVLTILSPKEGQTITGTTVTVVVSLKNARIVKPVTTHIVPTQGHIHVLLDNDLVLMTASLKTTLPVKPGHHVIEVDFVASDHLPFNPPIVAIVSIDVKA